MPSWVASGGYHCLKMPYVLGLLFPVCWKLEFCSKMGCLVFESTVAPGVCQNIAKHWNFMNIKNRKETNS
jgi:hypothetical protein